MRWVAGTVFYTSDVVAPSLSVFLLRIEQDAANGRSSPRRPMKCTQISRFVEIERMRAAASFKKSD